MRTLIGTDGQETIPGVDTMRHNEFSAAPVLTLIIRRRRLVGTWVGAALAIGLGQALITPKQYTATTSFMIAPSQMTSQFSNLGAIASRFGANLAGLNSDNTPRVLETALQSREVLDAILVRELEPMRQGGASGDGQTAIRLLEWYRISDGPLPQRLEDGRKALAKRFDVSLDERTGILALQVTDRDPAVAAAIAQALVDELNRFNLQTRQSVSHESRVFLERRAGEVEQQLTRAEDALRDFLERNRTVGGAPQLQTEQQRLQRRIDFEQQVYLELAQELEQARSDEVKDTPVLTVIEHAVPPARRSWPKRKLIVAAWILVGFVASLVWVAVTGIVSRLDMEGEESWREFRTELHGVLQAWRKP